MTFEQYLAILQKRWKLIVMCFVVVGLGTYIGNKLITPLYQSTSLVEVAITSNNSDINNLLASDQLVQTEAALATSDPVLREVASHFKGLTVDQLTREVIATAKLNTQLFEIDVTDASPTRAAAIANDVAAVLIKQQQQMSQQENAQGGFLILVQSAQPNTNPVQPNTRLNLAAGLLVGLFLGMLLAVLFDRFDTRVRNAGDLVKLLQWNLLSTIPQVKPEEVINPAGQSSYAESYRILRTNIEFSVVDKPLRSLLITSAMPGEGKSITAANLAIFMAKSGKNTLLVDIDLHRPVQQTLFGLTNNINGLSNAIVAVSMLPATNSLPYQQFLSPLSPRQKFVTPIPSSFSLEPFIYSVGIPNLRVMPAGQLPPNPAELLDSKAMRQLMLFIQNCGAEIVIFDGPPLLGTTDATILTAMVDATLMIVDITRAKKKSLKQTKTFMEQTGSRILGCVVNKQNQKHNDSGYIYYNVLRPETDGNNGLNEEKRNGHFSTAPKASLLPLPPGEQRNWPN